MRWDDYNPYLTRPDSDAPAPCALPDKLTEHEKARRWAEICAREGGE